MGKAKYRFELFSLYDATGVVRHLEQMAAKGWMLRSIGRNLWRYEQIEPKELHFSATFRPKASSFDPDMSEEKDAFLAFCERSGWTFVAGWERMQIFCNEQRAPLPLDTDPETQLRTIHRAMRATRIAYFIIIFISLFLAYGFVGRLITAPISALADSLGFFTGGCTLILVFICSAELLAYYRWRRRARQAAKMGDFFPTKGVNRCSAISLGLLALLFVYYLLSMRTGYMGFVAIVFPLCIFLGVRMGEVVKRRMRRRGADADNNRMATAGASGITTAVLIAFLLPLLTGAANDHPDPEFLLLNDPPVDFAVLAEQDSYIRKIDYNHSFLFTEYTMALSSYEGADEPLQLEFTVTKSNIPILDNWCKEQTLDRYASWRLRDIKGEYRPIERYDGSGTLWQFYTEQSAANRYLLCYDHHFAEVHPDWVLSADQLTTLADMLKTA